MQGDVQIHMIYKSAGQEAAAYFLPNGKVSAVRVMGMDSIKQTIGKLINEINIAKLLVLATQSDWLP